MRLIRNLAIAITVGSISAAASASPPPPVICEPFVVFFDWDSAAITPYGAFVLDHVVEACANDRCPHLTVSAHADSSGSRAYNVQLSRRRAHAVAAFLERRGLQLPKDIAIAGEDRPVRITSDGVREPFNRFVSIDSCASSSAPADD